MNSPRELPASLLVVNRGEIARRIVRTAQRLAIRTVVVHAPQDADLPFVREADEAVALESSVPAQAYMDIDRILEVARERGVEAIHPGYGFLSESFEFAEAVETAGLVWVGPASETIRTMGDKIEARGVARRAGVPVGGGQGQALASIEDAISDADRIGYPVILKASAGGGGIGMSIASSAGELISAFESTRRRSEQSFGSAAVFLEPYVHAARHVEVQVLGLADGRVLSMGERDCSVQRRHQKIAEETPAPGLHDDVRVALHRAAVVLGEAIGYRNAGTVEFLVDSATGEFTFLEVNTRIQVEHPVTELVSGIDLVEEQLRIAVGAPTTFNPEALSLAGHAIEFRVYAEDSRRFFPAPGRIAHWEEPAGQGIRVDSGYASGNEVTQYFDPLMAKLCTYATTRSEALALMRRALDDFVIEGPGSNLEFLRALVESQQFTRGEYDTSIVTHLQTAISAAKG